MDKLLKQFFTQIKNHRETSRLWFEGTRLDEAGFAPGVMYRVELNKDEDKIRIVLDPEGDRKVSKRKRRGSDKLVPIIDICRRDIAAPGTRIRADFYEGLIIVTLHHEDADKEDRERRLTEVAVNGAMLREASICTGIGVSTLAVHETLSENGIQSSVEWVVEADGRYLQIADDNNPAIPSDVTLFEGKLEEIDPDSLTKVDGLSFSLPCDVHSLAGKSKNGNKEAEDLAKGATIAFGLINAVKKSNPAFLKSENVLEARDSAMYKMIKAELRRIGYVIYEYIVDSEVAGTLEDRNRWYFLAVSEGLAQFFDFDNLPTYERIHTKMGDIMEDIPFDDKMWCENTYLKEKVLRDQAKGNRFPRSLITPESTKCSLINKHYAKKQSTGAFWVREEDDMERLLTKNEVCDVMRIPKFLVEGVDYTPAIQGLGQSVSFTGVKAVMQIIANGINKMRKELEVSYQPKTLCI